MNRAVGIIPARWSSTRFPGKPLHLIAGKALLWRVWERCERAKSLDSVIIATDDMRIAEAAFNWGAEVALTSTSHCSGTDRIAEVARNAKQFAFIINIQGDEPLVDPRLIDKIVEKLRSDRTIKIVTAAHPFEYPEDALSPHQVKVVVDLAGNALYFSRAPIPFQEKGCSLSLRHQGIYGFRRTALLQFVNWKPTPLERAESLEQLRALENGVKVHVLITAKGSPGIDTPADAEALEQKLARVERKCPSMKYIFVTGGVVSSLGKGLTAASLGTLLEARKLRVVLQKFDPYLNVDPGTMNPFQHGEVYVLNDGAETDLDLGHYERFTNCVLTRHNNLTSGQVYETVILKERRGDYLGKTVQVIPHVTDVIKDRIRKLSDESKYDVVITEIGGTTGDIEGLPFIEAIRQFILEVGPENVVNMHVTLVPYIKAAHELKTKPTQQSVAKLREIGLQPQVLICRSEKPLDRDVRRKLSMFCSVAEKAVIEERDVEHTIYEVPLTLHAEGLDQLVCDLLHLETPEPDLKDWRNFVDRVVSPSKRVKIAVVGKYMDVRDAYKSIYESLTHAAASEDCGIDLKLVDAESLADGVDDQLEDVAGVLIPGGFGVRGAEGKINAARYAREHRIPFLGLCLGMQVATIEFARNVCGIKDANSTEFDKDNPDPVISLLEEQRGVRNKGASMRLGTWPTKIVPGTLAEKIYGDTEVTERHRHRYEFNMKYRDRMNAKGFVISGTSPDGTLAELIELRDHPYFVGCQYHPEFQSKPNKPHPLFKGFIAAALAYQAGGKKPSTAIEQAPISVSDEELVLQR